MVEFIDDKYTDEQAKELLLRASNTSNLPIRISNDMFVRRFCEGGQSLPLNINDEYVVRLPKSQATLDEMSRESLISQTCAKYVKNTPISNVSICTFEQYSLAIHKSINGKTMDMGDRENNVHYGQLNDTQKQLLASDLASFLSELHQIPKSESQIIPNNNIDYFQEKDFTENQAALLKYGIDLGNYIPEDEDMVCCHNDLHGRNIAIDENKEHVLQGVFDFGMCGFNKRSADFVKLYTIDRELARKTMEEYNKISPQKVDIKSADGQFLAWCAANIRMAENLPDDDREKIMSSMKLYLGNFKNDVHQEHYHQEKTVDTRQHLQESVDKSNDNTDELDSRNVNEFNLPNHIINVYNGIEFSNISSDKQNLIAGMIYQDKGILINRQEEGNNHPVPPFFDEASVQHIEGTRYLNNILDNLKENNPSLKSTLDDFHLTFRIARTEKADAVASLKDKANKQGEIVFNSQMFTEFDSGAIALVLGHELGHLIEQSKRPQEGELPGINCKAVEYFCDVVGKSWAENAGYDTSQFATLLATSPKRDDATSDHPSPDNRMRFLEEIENGARKQTREVPQSLQHIMRPENWGNQNSSESPTFNLETHLRGLADKYCEGMPEDEKAKLLDRITGDEGNKKYSVLENRSENDPLHIVSDKGQKVYELNELSDIPTAEKLNEMEAEGKLLPNKEYVNKDKNDWLWKFKRGRHNKRFRQHQEQEKRVKGIIEKLAGNDSKISKDLAEILSKTDLEIRIRNWKRPNASVCFQKSEDETKKNKAVLMVSDRLFQGKNQKALVGFLAHELGHVLDFSQRPNSAKTQYMDGAETLADIAGTQLAVNAGLDSRGFGKYMGDDYRKMKIEYNYTASGTFREETMNTAYENMVKVRDNEKPKDTNKKKRRKDGLKIMELQGRVSKSTERTSSSQNQPTHSQGATLPNYGRASGGR